MASVSVRSLALRKGLFRTIIAVPLIIDLPDLVYEMDEALRRKFDITKSQAAVFTGHGKHVPDSRSRQMTRGMDIASARPASIVRWAKIARQIPGATMEVFIDGKAHSVEL